MTHNFSRELFRVSDKGLHHALLVVESKCHSRPLLIFVGSSCTAKKSDGLFCLLKTSCKVEFFQRAVSRHSVVILLGSNLVELTFRICGIRHRRGPPRSVSCTVNMVAARWCACSLKRQAFQKTEGLRHTPRSGKQLSCDTLFCTNLHEKRGFRKGLYN